MAEFIPIRTVQNKLDSISIVNGQVIFVVDTKKIFIDIDEKTRKEIGGIEGVDFLSKVDPVATGSFGLNYDEDYTLREGGCLADIVPTLIEMMGMEQPAEMTGKSLLVRK